MAARRGPRDRRKTDVKGGFGRRARTALTATVSAVAGAAILVFCYWLGVSAGLISVDEGRNLIASGRDNAAHESAATYSSAVARDTDEVWAGVFVASLAQSYAPPRVAFFDGQATSACGRHSTAYYCAEEGTVYLDTGFIADVTRSAAELGDLAAAYVIARRIAEHVQTQQAERDPVSRILQQRDGTQIETLRLRLALQRECYAGIWARRARARIGRLVAGEVEQVIQRVRDVEDAYVEAAAAPPPLDPRTRRAEHLEWFMRGYQSASLQLCGGAMAGSL